MPPAAPVPVSKQDFQGDVLDREFKILRDAKTGEYMFDYVEITPEVKNALEKILYYRLKSAKLSDIEAAVKARSKGNASPTNNGKTGSFTPAGTGTGNRNNTGERTNGEAPKNNGSSSSGNGSSNTGSPTITDSNFQKALKIFQNLKEKNDGEMPLTEIEQQQLKNAETTIDLYEAQNPNAKTGNGSKSTGEIPKNNGSTTSNGTKVPKEQHNKALAVYRSLTRKYNSGTELSTEEQAQLTNAEATIKLYETQNPNAPNGDGEVPKAGKGTSSSETDEGSKMKPTTQEEDNEYCDAKDVLEKLAKGVKISANSEKRYRNVIASYTAKFNNSKNIPACAPVGSRVAPPPSPTASTTTKAGGGKRKHKTKKAKKAKKSKSRKH